MPRQHENYHQLRHYGVWETAWDFFDCLFCLHLNQLELTANAFTMISKHTTKIKSKTYCKGCVQFSAYDLWCEMVARCDLGYTVSDCVRLGRVIFRSKKSWKWKNPIPLTKLHFILTYQKKLRLEGWYCKRMELSGDLMWRISNILLVFNFTNSESLYC